MLVCVRVVSSCFFLRRVATIARAPLPEPHAILFTLQKSVSLEFEWCKIFVACLRLLRAGHHRGADTCAAPSAFRNQFRNKLPKKLAPPQKKRTSWPLRGWCVAMTTFISPERRTFHLTWILKSVSYNVRPCLFFSSSPRIKTCHY